MKDPESNYRGRLAPSPTGLLHLGHARTFWTAQERARAAGGTLLLRNDDLDTARCRPEFVTAMQEDMRWFGLDWQEPMVTQSERIPLYRDALARLHAAGLIFPCSRSRRDVLAAASAPHDGEENDEPLYPPEFRPAAGAPLPPLTDPIAVNWRFRVPDGEVLAFTDGRFGPQQTVAGRDFGDFLVWRKDDAPSYQLACVVDDAAMGITEVVRGADLIKSTFRQLLLFRALALPAPTFYHCPLVTDDQGARLAKRHDALALRTLREHGRTPETLRAAW
ncbi:MAG: tRNA glutamyl-Q(34) synthetase GluQRS [Opitutaceae bacterium]|nr:tRNA glutamyl-Q(34) synthetase GluQRS [Opitutaceae bacterium]